MKQMTDNQMHSDDYDASIHLSMHIYLQLFIKLFLFMVQGLCNLLLQQSTSCRHKKSPNTTT